MCGVGGGEGGGASCRMSNLKKWQCPSHLINHVPRGRLMSN